MFAAILRASSLVSKFAAPVGMFHRRKKAACGKSCEVYAFPVEPKARFPLASLRFDSLKDVAFGNCNIAWGDKAKPPVTHRPTALLCGPCGKWRAGKLLYLSCSSGSS